MHALSRPGIGSAVSLSNPVTSFGIYPSGPSSRRTPSEDQSLFRGDAAALAAAKYVLLRLDTLPFMSFPEDRH